MVTSGALRVVEREAQVFRRLWRGSAFSTFLTPVLFLAAIGLGLGGLVDADLLRPDAGGRAAWRELRSWDDADVEVRA